MSFAFDNEPTHETVVEGTTANDSCTDMKSPEQLVWEESKESEGVDTGLVLKSRETVKAEILRLTQITERVQDSEERKTMCIRPMEEQTNG